MILIGKFVSYIVGLSLLVFAFTLPDAHGANSSKATTKFWTKDEEKAFADACVKALKSAVGPGDAKTLESRMVKACDCQAKAVFRADLPKRDIKEYQQFLAGEITEVSKSAGMTKVARVYNKAEIECEK